MALPTKRFFAAGVILGLMTAAASAGLFFPDATEKDVTNDPAYQGEFKPGTEWVTVVDLFSRREKPTDTAVLEDPDAKRPLKQYPPDERPHPSVAEWKAAPDRYSTLTLIAPGQRIQITKLVERTTSEFSCVQIFGRMRGGDPDGKEVYLNLVTLPMDPESPAAPPRKANPKLLQPDATPTTRPTEK